MAENRNLFIALHNAFPADLDATAIETADGEPLRYSWRDLERAGAKIANLLDWLELPPGARVAVHAGKSVEALLLYLAVLRAGCVYVPLNPAYQRGELEYFFGDAQPSVVVCAKADFGWVSKLAFQCGARHVFTLDGDRSGTLLDRAAHHGDRHEAACKFGTDVAAIVYTSGTTGRSKGAMLSHASLLANATTLKSYWDWQPDDVLIHALPIFHVHGLFVASHGALLNGSKMIWLDRFEPQRVLDHLPGATVFMGVPTMYMRLLAQAGLTAQACLGMRLFVSGSAPLLPATFEDFRRRTGHTILERYGMSETLMLTSNPCRAADGERRAGTAGRALPGVDLRICDERAQVLAAGETGGIEVRGPSVFEGYWRRPERAHEDFATDAAGHRWFQTGDTGRLDDKGYLTIVGRSKDLVISGGFNVYPAEIEAAVNALPGVAESAVIGAPHPDFGEAVVALAVAAPGAPLDSAALLATLKATIAGFKVPKRLFVVAELPRNAMGKVQKKLLREQYADVFLAALPRSLPRKRESMPPDAGLPSSRE